jgi:hypothetical protein
LVTCDMFDFNVEPTLLQVVLDFVGYIPVRHERVIWVCDVLIRILKDAGDEAFTVGTNCGLHRGKVCITE